MKDLLDLRFPRGHGGEPPALQELWPWAAKVLGYGFALYPLMDLYRFVMAEWVRPLWSFVWWLLSWVQSSPGGITG